MGLVRKMSSSLLLFINAGCVQHCMKNDKKIAPFTICSLGNLGFLSNFMSQSFPCQYHQLTFSHTKTDL